MKIRVALEAAAVGCSRRVAAMDRGWKASALGIGLLAVASLL
jgi:hypothetical protein